MVFRVMIVNRSRDVNRSELIRAVKSIDIQLKQHFGPAWNITSRCFLERKSKLAHDAIIYVDDHPDIDGAAGYHDYDGKGVPMGYVFLSVSKELGEPFSVTLSHEVLELVLNRHCAYYAIGQHPGDRRKKAALWLEACDAVQDQTYRILGTEVSDFVLPAYFTPFSEAGTPNNYCSDRPVESFGVTKGGYIGFYDFDLKSERTFFADDRAIQRHDVKGRIGGRRRKARLSALLAS